MIGVTIGGIVLILTAVGLVFGYKKQGEKLLQIKATETFSTAELHQEASDVADGLGEKGSFNKIAEVKGKIKCDNPLKSELAQISCVHYSMRVTRKWEEKYWDTDSEGRQVQKTRSGTDTVASNTRSVPFEVEDSSGRIKIEPSGAQLITEKVFSQFQPGELRGTSVTIGGFSLNLGGISISGGRRTIGYSYEEQAIPVERDVYILGEAADSSGTVQMQKPSEKDKKYIISLKSEEELSQSIKGAMTGFMVGSVISALGGITLIILNVVGVFG